jgi:hypothetical protein
MAVSNNITVIWDVRPYSLVDGLQVFKSLLLLYTEDGSSRYLQNVSIYLQEVHSVIPKSQSSLSKCLDVFKQQQRRRL